MFFPLNGQHFGHGSFSGRVCLLAFLKTIRHLVPFVVGTRAQGYVVWIILIDLVQVLLEWSSVVTYVVEDPDVPSAHGQLIIGMKDEQSDGF